MHWVVCYTCWTVCMLVGLDWAEPMMILLLHVTCSCIFMHTYLTFNIFLYIWTVWSFSYCFFLPPLSLSLVYVSVSWHQNVSLLCPGTFFIPGHRLLLILPLLLFNSVIRMPERTSQRTFLDKVFIGNAESFCWTSPILTYQLSFTIGVGSHCVTSQSHVHPCWSKSFSLTCMDLILQYLSFILTFEVRT